MLVIAKTTFEPKLVVELLVRGDYLPGLFDEVATFSFHSISTTINPTSPNLLELLRNVVDEVDDQLLLPASASPWPLPVDVRALRDDVLHEVLHVTQLASFFSKILLQHLRSVAVVQIHPVTEIGTARAEPKFARTLTII